MFRHYKMGSKEDLAVKESGCLLREKTQVERGVTLLQVLLCQLQPQGVLFMAEAGSRMFPEACKALAMPNWGFFNITLLFNHSLAPI